MGLRLFKYLLISVLLFFINSTFAQKNPDILQAWDHIAQNDLMSAKESFEKALGSDEKHYAHLGLSYVGAAISNNSLRLENYLKFIKTAPNPDPYLIALWTGTGMIDYSDPDPYLEVLEQFTVNRKGTIKILAYETLGSYYKSINKMSKAMEYFNMIGSVETWQVVGEFENISESGFNVDHGPLAHPEKDFDFTNKRGVDVKWFELTSARPDKWVDFAYHFYIDNSVIYAQNWVNSPVEQEVQFRIGTSGSLKCWINDKLMFKEAEERNNGIDTYIFTAKLQKGYNRILLQVGASEISMSNFLLRITDKNGDNIKGLTYTTSMRSYPSNYTYESKTIEDPIEKFFNSKLKENNNDLQHLLALSQHYLKNDKIYPAKKILKTAKNKYPDCSYITFQLIETYYRDDNRTGVSTYLEELKVKDPKGIQSLGLLFEEAMDIEDYKEAERLLEEKKKIQGITAGYYADKIQILSKKQEVEEIIKTANKAYDEYPMDWQFVVLKYYLEKEVKKNVAAGVKIVKKYAKERYNSEAINILVENAFSNGDVNAGIKEFEKLLEANPLATGYYSRLSSIYFSLGNYTKSREMAEKCLEIAPYVGSYHSTLASAYEEMNEDDKAEAGYMKAIKYDPYDYDAREMLRNLKDEKDIFTHMSDFENYDELDVYEIFKNSPDGDAYPEDNSLILIDEVQKVIYQGGGSEERHTLAIKVFNSSGVDRWKEYYISLYGNQSGILEKAEVLKANGSKLTAEQSGSQLVFTNLEPGDAIYLVYKVQNYYSGKLTNHFWDKHHIESFFPKLHTRFSLMVPKGRKFNYEVLNGNTSPQISSDERFELYTWDNKDVESIKYEPYMSDLSDVGEVLHISSFENWDYVAEWYAGLAQAKSKADFEIQETVAELFTGKENLSDLEKVKEIYNYITQNIRYSSVSFIQSGLVPQKASRVINAKQGDCKDVSTLFVAMCKTQGIDANLVLVNTRDNGQRDMILPSIAFNHCIAKVNLADESYYLELTGENLPFASGSSSLKHAFVLEIPKDPSINANAEIINPKTRTPNNTIRNSTITFEGQTMKVRKETYKTGTKASSMRNSYKNEGKETQFKYMQEAINGLYPTMKLVELNFVDGLTNNSETIHYKYGYDVPDVFSEISGLSIFKLPWADGWKSPDFISAESRKFPIELWKYFTGELYEETLTIQPPAGKVFSDIPSNLTLSNEYIDYSIVYTKEGNNLKVVRKFIIKDDVVKKEDYTDFKTFFGKIVKSDEQNLAFK